MIIYKAENKINNKMYIGQTKYTLERRKSEHLNEAKSGKGSKFHSAIRKYGEENFVWSIIDTAKTFEDLTEKGCYWIEYYKSYERGYNSTKGDNNPMNYEPVKNYHDEIMRSDKVRQKISNTMKKLIADGKMFDSDHRRKISEKLKGNRHFAGHKRTPEAIAATAKSLRKCVVCYDENNNLVKSFNSVREASKWLYNDRCTDLKSWDDLQNRIKRIKCQTEILQRTHMEI